MANELETTETIFTGLGAVDVPKEAPVVTVGSKEQLEDLPEGTRWKDPEGGLHTKPYKPADPDAFWAVPEGAQWQTPEGEIRTKPHYQGVGYTAAYLHSLAQTDEAREQALRVVYGDKVRRVGSKLYVDDDGVLRVPEKGMEAAAGRFAAETPIAAGMMAGGLAGGAAGGVPAVGGAMLGAAAGRYFDNLVLSMAGVHPGSPMEQAKEAGWEGVGVAGGEVAGRALSKVPGVVAAGARQMGKAGERLKGVATGLADIMSDIGVTPERARYFLGVRQEEAQQVARIANRDIELGGTGQVAGPAVVAPGAPMLTKIGEWHDMFEGRSRFGEAAAEYYGREAPTIVKAPEIAAVMEQPFIGATARPSSMRAGEMVLESARRDVAHDDALLENARREAIEAARAPIEARGGEARVARAHEAAVEKLAKAVETSQRSAKNFLSEAINSLREDVNIALAAVKNGEDPSATLRMADGALRGFNAAERVRAKNYYDIADEAFGQLPPPNLAPAQDAAKNFLDKVPVSLRDKYPYEVGLLARMANPQNNLAPLTSPQVRLLRSWLRHGIDYNDMTPGMKEGSLKFLERQVNKVLHTPELKPAADLLDKADAFYKDIIKTVDDEMVATTVKAAGKGMGLNPEALARIFFDPDRTAAMRKVRGIVGENLWNMVEAAHVNDLVNKSLIRNPDNPAQFMVDAKKFATAIDEEAKNGLLKNGYTTRRTEQLARIADDVAKLEGNLPIEAQPGDTLTMLLRRAETAKAQMEKLAKNDPLKALSKEVSAIDKRFNAEARDALKQRRTTDPLAFTAEPSALAVKAADRILGSTDLIKAAANRYGSDSPEFNALRQVFALRFFQRAFDRLGLMRGELGGEIGAPTAPIASAEIQALMFPGVTEGQMTQLAKDMEFLFKGVNMASFGGGIAGAARVINPLSHVPIPVPKGPLSWIMHTPLVSAAARWSLGKIYAISVDATTHPNFVNWLAGELKGDPTQREMAKAVVNERLRLGGWFGAVTGQQLMEPSRTPGAELPDITAPTQPDDTAQAKPSKQSFFDNFGNIISSAEAAESPLHTTLPEAAARTLQTQRKREREAEAK